MANAEYKRNCLSGPTSKHGRKVTFNRIATGEEVELSVPGEQALPLKTLRTIRDWFKKDPEHTSVVVLFNKAFMFNPNEVTTGSKSLDDQLIEDSSYGAATVIASMSFQAANKAKVTLKGSAITLSTGWVHVNGQFTPDIIPAVPMPTITIASNGFITFK